MSSSKAKTANEKITLNVKALSTVSIADVERARLFFIKNIKGKRANIIEAQLKKGKK